MTAIKQWLASKGGLAHVLALTFIFFVAAYKYDTQFHDYVNYINGLLPTWLQTLIVVGIGLYGFYKTWSGASSTATTSNVANISQQKLQAWMLIAILLSGTMASVSALGCSQQQKITVAQAIVNDTPAVIAAVDVIGAGISTFDPPAALIVSPFLTAFNALAPQFQTAAQAYLANPNQTTLQVLSNVVTQLEQNANAALLSAVKISNPQSQAIAQKDLQALAAIINTVVSLVQSISTKAMLVQMAQPIQLADGSVRHITLAQVRAYEDVAQLQAYSDATTRQLGIRHVSTDEWFAREAAMGM